MIQLKYHIANQLLNNNEFVMGYMEKIYPEEYEYIANHPKDTKPEISEGFASLYQCLSAINIDKTYYVTNTVYEKLEMLHVKKQKTIYKPIQLKDALGENTGEVLRGEVFMEPAEAEPGEMFDWTVFKNIKDRKVTFIMEGQECLRLLITDEMLHFSYFLYTPDPNHKGHGVTNMVMFYVDRITGAQCDHFNHRDVKSIETWVYKLMCFMYLTENDEIIVNLGQKWGTKKQGKIINTLPFPITVVNSRWNTTVIRTEKFGVRGHFALRWAGIGKTQAKIVFIEPYEKKGYIRKAGNLEN